jgi:predicted aconitase
MHNPASASLDLSTTDREMLEGLHGPAASMAMRLLVRMAHIWGARELLDISQAHIDSTIYIGEATLEYAERFAQLGARVRVPTTLNVSGVDEHHWQEWATPAGWAHNAARQMAAYQGMGCQPTWTCAPYQVAPRPRLGEQIAWGESSAIVFANSVLGARTERYPDLLDICCAITGRAPAAGLHLEHRRAGQILLVLQDIPASLQQADSFYPVLGFILGRLALDRIPVLDGFSIKPGEDQLKALGAAAASSGGVALYHIVGITPEAPDREAAFQGNLPQQIYPVTLEDLRQSWQALNTADGEDLDLVVLGSPHFSLAEFQRLAPLLHGKQRHPSTRFLVTSSRAVVHLAEKAGLLEDLRSFGGQITVDTCILAAPMLPPEIRRLMTNSGKFAYYSPGLLGTQVVFGSLEECVLSAQAGRVVRQEAVWQG